MKRRRPADVIQDGGINALHMGTGDINFGSGPPYVLEEFPATTQVKFRDGPLSRLLAADMQVVPFDPRRDPDLDRLAQWRDKREMLQVMLVSGPGGQGKTRLVGEFARRCAEAGWVVARARQTTDVKSGATRATARAGSAGHLLIVDYAERWPADDLLSVFDDRFVRHETATRVLLVARPAGPWWVSLSQELYSLAPDPDHLRLSALAPSSLDRRAVFEHARDAFAEALGVAGADRLKPPASLDDPAYGLALSLHMAALVAVDAYARGETAPGDPAKLTSYLVRREYAHWGRMLRSGQIHAAGPQVAGVTLIATLTQPMPWTAAEKVLVTAGLADNTVSARALLRDHQACYPADRAGTGTALEPLYPDRLGEDFVAVHLSGGPSRELELADGSFDSIPASLLRTTTDDDDQPPAYARNVMTMLVETARRWPHLADGYLYPLLRDRPELAYAAGGATLAAVAENADIALLERVEQGLPPDRQVDLDVAAAVITQRLTEHRLAETNDPAARARLNATLAWRLFNAGLYKEAVRASAAVVQSYRQLAQASPAEFTPDLARALYDMSVLLSALNRDEALALGWEAVYTYLSLSNTGPSRFEGELAQALYFLSVILSVRGQQENAVSVAEYAVEVYQRLTGSGQAGLEPDFARALCSLSRLLSGLGRPEDALAATQQAVPIYRAVAEAGPAAFEEDLARALQDMAGILGRLGREEEALSAAEQAIPIYQRLAEANPVTLGPGLGQVLYQRSALLWAAGRKDDAVVALEETIQVLLTAANVGHVSHERVWSAYNALAELLQALGRPEEAVAAREQGGNYLLPDNPHVYRLDLAHEDVLAIVYQAVQAYSWLAANNAAFKPPLPYALRELSATLAELGRLEEALAATREAVHAYRGLDADNAARFIPDLVDALRELSAILAQLGRPEEALAATQEAVQAYRELPADDPVQFSPGLAKMLRELSDLLAQLGRLEEALAATQEAVQAYRGLAADNPARFIPDLVGAVSGLLVLLSGLRRREEALTAAAEAVRDYRALAATNPALFAPYLTAALSDLSGIVWDLALQEALAPAREAVHAYRRLAAANPAVFGPHLAQRLRALSGMLSELGQHEEALAAAQEAVQAYQALAAANPAVFGPEQARALSDLQAGLPRVGREESFTAAERIFQDAATLARHNGLAFIVALHDHDDSVGLARLLADVRLPESRAKTAFVACPATDLEFLATGTSPADRHNGDVAPGSAVVYLLDHQPGLSQRLLGVEGTFYVGVPDLVLSDEYSDSVRVLLTAGPLDFASVIMRDYCDPGSLHDVVFDEGEALRMQYLASDFPFNLHDPAFGPPEPSASESRTPSSFPRFELTLESQQRARSAYRPPE